jgi:hypothetical protein
MSSKDLKPKKQSTDKDDFLDAAVESSKREFSLNQTQKLFFFFFAYLTTFLPSYLYQGVLNLEFSGLTIALYITVSTAAAYILSLAYENIFLRTRVTLSERYERVIFEAKGSLNKATKQAQNEFKTKMTKFTELGTTGYTLAFTNLLFLMVTLFFGFYALKRTDVRVNYFVSLLVSAGLVYWLSSTRSKKHSA